MDIKESQCVFALAFLLPIVNGLSPSISVCLDS